MELPASYASGMQPLGLGRDAEASPVISSPVSDSSAQHGRLERKHSFGLCLVPCVG